MRLVSELQVATILSTHRRMLNSDPAEVVLQYCEKALEDKNWNAVTYHSVYDIINIRIPQLRKGVLNIETRNFIALNSRKI